MFPPLELAVVKPAAGPVPVGAVLVLVTNEVPDGATEPVDDIPDAVVVVVEVLLAEEPGTDPENPPTGLPEGCETRDADLAADW